MMQGIGRDMQTIFPACIQATVILGFMLSGTPSGMAAGSAMPCVHSDSTQTNSTQVQTYKSGHVDRRANTTGNKSADAEKSEGMVKSNSINHKHGMKHESVKSYIASPPETVKPEGAISTAVKPGAKAFDMDMLIDRLKKSNAIGMFTKLALRSDALDIIDMINAYNKHRTKYSLKELRSRFNGLVLKVLALLDDDPKLSRDISLAREEIWKSLLTAT